MCLTEYLTFILKNYSRRMKFYTSPQVSFACNVILKHENKLIHELFLSQTKKTNRFLIRSGKQDTNFSFWRTLSRSPLARYTMTIKWECLRLSWLLKEEYLSVHLDQHSVATSTGMSTNLNNIPPFLLNDSCGI